jgi:hypothetical protein
MPQTEVEARSLTDYVARTILASREQRDHRHALKSAPQDHQSRLASDFGKAADYYATARELASEAKDLEPQFSDKEKINLEIYAEGQNELAERERYLEMARGENDSRQRGVSDSLSR